MAAPVLNDYEYQYKDSGFRLNQNLVATPFFDATKLTGLSDLPEYDAKIDDVDSIDGGIIYVKYSKHRIVTIEGILYVSPATVDATLETLVANFTPDNIDWPFYFKHPGISQKYLLGKALGFASDVETLRRTGACNCLITIGCQDPVKRLDNGDVNLSNGSNISISNAGPTKTWPTFVITGGVGTQIVVTNNLSGGTLTLARSFIGTDVTTIDMRNRVVFVNGVQNSTGVSGNFWGLDGNSSRNVKYTWTGSTLPSSVVFKSYNGWM